MIVYIVLVPQALGQVHKISVKDDVLVAGVLIRIQQEMVGIVTATTTRGVVSFCQHFVLPPKRCSTAEIIAAITIFAQVGALS